MVGKHLDDSSARILCMSTSGRIDRVDGAVLQSGSAHLLAEVVGGAINVKADEE